MSSNQEDCIFCNKTNCTIISKTKHFFIIRDTAYPVTKHHTLIITNRHVADFFELTKEEMSELDEILKNQKKELKKLFLLGIIQVDQLHLQSLEAQKELQQMLLESLNHADKSDN